MQTGSVGRAGADAFNRTLEVAAADGVSIVVRLRRRRVDRLPEPPQPRSGAVGLKAVSFPASLHRG